MGNHTIESKALINDSGKILIPANIRKALNLNIGYELLFKVEEDEIHMAPLSKATPASTRPHKAIQQRRAYSDQSGHSFRFYPGGDSDFNPGLRSDFYPADNLGSKPIMNQR